MVDQPYALPLPAVPLGELTLTDVQRAVDTLSVAPGDDETACQWCKGDGRVTAAPIHNGHEVEELRIRILCPVCRGTGRDA